MCESYNPGNVGDVEKHENRRKRTRGGAVFTGVISFGILLTPVYLIASNAGDGDAFSFAMITLAVEAVYLFIAYFVNPKPDTSNLGWCGGLMDNPFRISDDFNRSLLFFAVILYPGRLLAIGVVDFFRAFWAS